MKRLWFWYLDYWFVSLLQVRALFSRTPPEAFSTGELGPVVLVAGVWEPWYFLRSIGARLNGSGHPVHVVSAIGYNRGSVADVAALVQRYVDEHDLHEVTVVAHSKGGLVGKHLLASSARISQLVAIATPFSGSVYANYLPSRTLSAFRPADAALVALGANLEVNARITSIYPSFDPHIPGGSYLEGAINIEVPTTGHFRILADERVITAVENALGRKNEPSGGVE